MKFSLVVPAKAETSCTGLIMAAEKTIGKTHWRLEAHSGEVFARVFRNGKRYPGIACAPAMVRKLNNAFVPYVNNAVNGENADGHN